MMTISYSKFASYIRCPKAYWFRYIEGLVVPPPGSVILGRAFDDTVNANYLQKITTKQDFSLEEALDTYLDSWRNAIDEVGGEVDWEGKFTEGQAEDEKTCVNDGENLVRVYHTNIAPHVQPIDIQKEIKAEVEGIQIIGFLDIEEKNTIIDTKTATKGVWTQDKVDHDQQLVVYSLVYGPKKKYRYDIAERPRKNVKNRTYETKCFYRQISEEDKKILLEDIYNVILAIEAGAFPRRKSPQNCRYCGYKPYCW